MTQFRLHHDDVHGDAGLGFVRERHISPRKAFRRARIVFGRLRQTIASASLRPLVSKLVFRPDYREILPPEQDATKFPQRPLVLGDKWDF